jgi:manganese/iron transport system substrate-binding protein
MLRSVAAQACAATRLEAWGENRGRPHPSRRAPRNDCVLGTQLRKRPPQEEGGIDRRKSGKSRLVVVATAFAILFFGAGASARDKPLRIVATTADLASLAQSVAGDFAQVDVLIPPGADPEAFEPRPSDLAKLRDASVVVRVGLGFDHWLDKLLTMHGDATVNRRGAGYVDASAGIPLLEVKGSSLDPAPTDGHAHGLANPHYWLDPANAETMTAAIAGAVAAVAPSTKEKIAARRAEFLAGLESSLARWESMLAPHRGAKLIAYHNTWPYFARRFRLDIVDVIESKEGVAPSPARLAKLASIIRAQSVHVILHEPFAPDDAALLLARRSGAALLKLAPSVGSAPEAPDYGSLFDHDVAVLAHALSAPSN